MRKDVKFGLTIGAILVVTLVIYVIVLSRGPSVPPRIGIVMPSQSSQQNTSSETTGESTDSTDATHTDAANSAAPDSSAAANGSGDSKTAPPAAAPDVEASTPTTQPTAAAPATANNDWEGALNHGPPISLAAPEHTVTPSIDATPSSTARNGNSITRAANVPMIDGLPSTQPSRPMFADVPVLDAPATVTPPPSYTAARPDPTPSVSNSAHDLSTPRTHRVASGESPYSISVAVYGSGKYFKRIMAANPGLDPRHLKIGQILVIPELNDSDKTASPAANNTLRARTVDPNSAYAVASGDTLESISRKLYGTPAMMDKLYEANKSLIGEDENVLKIGWVLKLPEAPSTATAQR